MGKHQFPQQQVDDLEPEFVSEVVGSLRELNELGKPETNEELSQRIDDYFSFCQRTGTRPGIECSAVLPFSESSRLRLLDTVYGNRVTYALSYHQILQSHILKKSDHHLMPCLL